MINELKTEGCHRYIKYSSKYGSGDILGKGLSIYTIKPYYYIFVCKSCLCSILPLNLLDNVETFRAWLFSIRL